MTANPMTLDDAGAENRVAFYLPEDVSVSETELSGGTGKQAKPELKLASSDTASISTPENNAGSESIQAASSKYGKPSMEYFEVAERSLRAPVNQNKSQSSRKYIPLLKVGVPILLGLAFLAWF